MEFWKAGEGSAVRAATSLKSSVAPALCAAAALLIASAAGLPAASGQGYDDGMIPPDVVLPLSTPPSSLPLPAASPAGQAAGQKAGQKDPLAIIETSKGAITIRLFRKFAPATVASFQELVQKGFYNGLSFHRVEPGFVIQGGCPHGNGSGLYIDPGTNKPRFLNLEVSPSLKHNAPGVVAMARFPKNPNSASCQFYITLAAAPQLDMKYSIFGGVVSGMEVVNQIAKGDKIVSIRIQESN